MTPLKLENQSPPSPHFQDSQYFPMDLDAATAVAPAAAARCVHSLRVKFEFSCFKILLNSFNYVNLSGMCVE